MAFDLTGFSASYTSSGAYGQALTGGRADSAAPVITAGVGSFTVRAKISFPNGGLAVAVGQSGVFWIGRELGLIAASYGSTNAKTLNSTVSADGSEHFVELNVGPDGGRLFIDGVLADFDPTTLAASGPSYSSALGLRDFAGGSAYTWNGAVDDVALYSGILNTANYTPPTAPTSPSSAGLLALYNLDGNLLDSAAPVAGPALTSPTGAATGATTATVGVTTDNATGTLYCVVTASATPPTAAQIKAGQTNAGATAPHSANQVVSSAGAKTFSATGLSASATYYAHFVHTSSAPADSNVASSGSFTTSSSPATAVTLTGPTSGAVGVASSNFTVGANGTISGTVTVTPSDGGAGGSFAPASVAISSGTPTATFTYTPASSGAKTISVTNNGGLANPSSITYTASAGPVVVGVTDPNWKFSPYNWDTNGSTKVAVNGGAYFKLGFTGASVAIGLDVSSLVAASVNAAWYPSIRYSVDNGPQTDVQLTPTTTQLSITGLAAGSHTISVYYQRGWWENIGGTAPDRWTTPVYCLKVTGATLDTGASTFAPAWESSNMLWFGDSISEGIRANNSDVQPGCQSAYESAPMFLARSLGCELGNVSFGGQSYTRSFNSVPEFNSAYGAYYAGRSRLVGGQFSPAPDYVCIWHGANVGATSTAVQTAIGNMRAAAPAARIFVIVPVGGFDRAAVAGGVAAYLAANASERKVFLIDLGTSWQVGLDGFGAATEQAIDKLHPRANWNARIAAALAVQIGRKLAATTATRTLSLTLTTDGTTPSANVSGLKWAFWDKPTPDAMASPPSDFGVGASTNGSGVLALNVRTSLGAGGVGWLDVTDSDGTVSQSPMKGFSGPVAVS